MSKKLDDICELLKRKSDFSFEMQILKITSDHNYKVKHSGTYLDPYTGVNREFDIRAEKMISDDKLIKLAIECKNISNDVPVVVHSVPNILEENYHSVLLGFENINAKMDDDIIEKNGGMLSLTDFVKFSPAITSSPVKHEIDSNGNIFASLYDNLPYLGKSIDKIGIKSKGQKNETLILNDEEIYNKYSQAINSAADLISEFNGESETPYIQCFVQPIFVVPDGSLLELRYDRNGAFVEGSPIVSSRVPVFIGKVFSEKELGANCVDHEVMYMEVVTESGLISLLEEYESNFDLDYDPVFLSKERVEEPLLKAINKYRK